MMLGVEAIQSDLPATQHAHIAQNDASEHGDFRTAMAIMHVVGLHEDRVLRLANTHVLVDYIAHQTSLTGVRLDAYSVVGAVDGQIRNTNCIGAAVGFASDRYAVSGIEMIVRDGHVRGMAAGLDHHIVVASMDVTMRDGYVGGRAGVNAIAV